VLEECLLAYINLTPNPHNLDAGGVPGGFGTTVGVPYGFGNH